MRAYKVVTKDRRSVNAVNFMDCTLTSEQEKYIKTYQVGTVVDAVPDSPGICCFTSAYYAHVFMHKRNLVDQLMVIEVDGVHYVKDGKYPLYSGWKNVWILGKHNGCVRDLPSGHIGFRRVRVLT